MLNMSHFVKKFFLNIMKYIYSSFCFCLQWEFDRKKYAVMKFIWRAKKITKGRQYKQSLNWIWLFVSIVLLDIKEWYVFNDILQMCY
jgi:hypothetical protein